MEKPGTSEPSCNVILLGPVSESSREQLVRGLEERFKLTPRQAETLVRKAPVVVKRGLTIERANAFVQHLEKIGARVRIERIFTEQEPAVAPRQEGPSRETMPPKTDEPAPESYCFWEDMQNLGFFKAFFGTLGDVLFHPSSFFSRMPVDRGLIHPLIFALVMGVLGGMFGLLYQFVMMDLLGRAVDVEAIGDFHVSMMIGSAIGLPIITIIVVFVLSAILHVCLMIVRGSRKGFEATFRVIAYAMSTQIFGIIPILGGLIGFIWALVIGIVGAREAHRISTGRATLAVFLPILVIIALVVVLAAVMIPIFLRAFQDIIASL